MRGLEQNCTTRKCRTRDEASSPRKLQKSTTCKCFLEAGRRIRCCGTIVRGIDISRAAFLIQRRLGTDTEQSKQQQPEHYTDRTQVLLVKHLRKRNPKMELEEMSLWSKSSRSRSVSRLTFRIARRHVHRSKVPETGPYYFGGLQRISGLLATQLSEPLGNTTYLVEVKVPKRVHQISIESALNHPLPSEVERD
ncbi:hypothetical protein PM082_004449 [Marasmius tenuissimus]|nr:hypothetical protein PM082_004449 [Marasmius tenuissimus]